LAIIQPYVQAQIRLTENLTLNAGVHNQFSTLNKQFTLEPRTSLSYAFLKNHSINIGYGLHYQSVPLPILFLFEDVNGEPAQTNRDLDFVKSNHFVLGYDVKLAIAGEVK